VLAAGAALLCVLVAAAAPAAGPSYAEWGAPVNLGSTINSPSSDAGPTISEDGLSLYFYSERPGGFGGRDILVSRRPSASGAWGAPINLGPAINTASLDFPMGISADGHWLYLVSDRPGGFGMADLYASWRADVHDDLGWQAPVNLGAGVNSSANDNTAGYFEDPGGAPQLYFSSERAGGLGNADLYVSTRGADGTWGAATPVSDLNSAVAEARPTLRTDGLEIIFYRGVFPDFNLWRSTRTTIGAPWSTPVDLGPPLSTTSNDLHANLATDGRTLFFASNRPGSLGGTDLYVTTRAAKLTVTANDQARLFGQANPALTYGLTGFVGGETAAVVSGTAACSTTATQSSPAGDYPITCIVGSLSAPGYVFETFVAGTLAVSYSQPCLTGISAGPLRVAAGEAICIGAGGSQTGPVTVVPGGSLDVEGGRITGPVTANGAAVVRICGATITGPLTVTGSTGPVVVGGEGCDPNTIVGPVRITDNSGGVEVVGNTVVGALRVTGNAAPVHATGNTVTGPVTIQS
jgi:hypothetical protein